MKKQRDHIIELLYHLYDNIKNLIIPITTFVISLISAHSKFQPFIITAFILFGIILVFHSFLAWYNKTYTIKERMIEYSDGIFKKRRNDIPIQNIRSINTTDSLIKRIIGISNLNIELIGGDEVSFVLNNKQIKELKKNIFASVDNTINKYEKTGFSFKEYLLMTTTNSGLFLTALSLILTSASFFLNHFAVPLGLETKQELVQKQKDTRGLLEKTLESDWTDTSFYFVLGIFLAIVIFLTFFITYFLVYLTYRNFKIHSTENEIEIKYGLLNKKHFHITRFNIRTIRIIEPFWYRLFGFASIKADNIGLNDKASKSLFIMPIARKELINTFLNQYTPDFKKDNIEFFPPIQALPAFIMRRTIWIIVIVTVLSFLTHYALWGYLSLPIFVLLGYMKWRCNGLTFNSHFIINSFSSGLAKITLITKKHYIESTGIRQTFLQQHRNRADYEYAVYSEKITEVYKCLSLSVQQKEEFLRYLKNEWR